MSCVGVATPSNSVLTQRVVNNPQKGASLFYFGDGRCDEATLKECLESQDYANLSGFFVALRLERASSNKEASVSRATLVRDRSGSFPLVYKLVDGSLLVAPRVSSLQFARASVEELDPLGIGFLLSTGYIPSSTTQFSSIRCVETGTATCISGLGKTTQNRYWRYPPSLHGKHDKPAQLLEQSIDFFRSAIAINYPEPEKTAVFLSGGVDSRAIVAACVAHSGEAERVHTVSWGETDSLEGSDAQIAQKLANAYGTTHRFMDKPTADFRLDFETACRLSDWSSDVAGMQPTEWRLMRTLAEDGMHTCLRGDQAFSGDRSAYSAMDALAVSTINQLSLQSLAKDLLRPDVFEIYSEAGDEFLHSLDRPAAYSNNDLRDLYRFEHEVPNAHLASSMYKSVYMDHRNPILDDCFLQVLPLMHGSDRNQKQLFKRIMASLASDVKEIPHAHRHSDPDHQQFFLAGGIGREYLTDSLNDTTSPVFDLFNRDSLLRLLNNIDTALPGSPAKSGYRKKLKRSAFQILARIHAPSAGAVGHRSRASSLPWQKAIRRFLLIKQLVDVHCR